MMNHDVGSISLNAVTALILYNQVLLLILLRATAL